MNRQKLIKECIKDWKSGKLNDLTAMYIIHMTLTPKKLSKKAKKWARKTLMEVRIRELSKRRNAIILAHNYQPPEIQKLADFCGDSLELSIKASNTDADVIVFCGVHFMAETASILSPNKTVLLPRKDVGCPMADMITAKSLQSKLNMLPSMPVVTYVNSSAAVKALSTVCCTSANVIDVVNSLDSDEILMTPDRNLAQFAAKHTDKKIHTWDGYCPIHNRLMPGGIKNIKNIHKDAIFIAHPECRPEVLELADVVTSTSGMLRYVEESKNKSFIIGTEVGILYQMRNRNPDKFFYPASENMVCEDMKKITPEDILNCLENMEHIIKVPKKIRVPALKAVQRMIDI